MLKPHVTLSKQTAVTKPLSSAAQAVLDAYETSYTESGLVAALRAVAEQVVSAEPEDKELDLSNRDDNYEWCQWSQRQHTRRQLLAIAAELEGADG